MFFDELHAFCPFVLADVKTSIKKNRSNERFLMARGNRLFEDYFFRDIALRSVYADQVGSAAEFTYRDLNRC